MFKGCSHIWVFIDLCKIFMEKMKLQHLTARLGEPRLRSLCLSMLPMRIRLISVPVNMLDPLRWYKLPGRWAGRCVKSVLYVAETCSAHLKLFVAVTWFRPAPAETGTCECSFPDALAWAVWVSASRMTCGSLRPCRMGQLLVEAVSKPPAVC